MDFQASRLFQDLRSNKAAWPEKRGGGGGGIKRRNPIVVSKLIVSFFFIVTYHSLIREKEALAKIRIRCTCARVRLGKFKGLILRRVPKTGRDHLNHNKSKLEIWEPRSSWNSSLQELGVNT